MAKQNQKQKSRRQRGGNWWESLTSIFSKPPADAVDKNAVAAQVEEKPVEDKPVADPSAVGGKKHKKSSKKSRSRKSRSRKHTKSVKR